jgi:hypothetical protein
MNEQIRILDWAKDRNDFFCIHELAKFFNVDITHISGDVSQLANQGKLTKTDVKSSCKWQDKKHSFWIYNKPREGGTFQRIREAIKGTPEEETRPTITASPPPKKNGAYKRGELKNKIVEWVKNSTSDFCVHGIMDGIGVAGDDQHRMQQIASHIKGMLPKGKLKRLEKRKCGSLTRNHLFYTYDNHGRAMRNPYAAKTRTYSKMRDGSMIEEIRKILQRDGTTCCHAINKEMGISTKASTSLLDTLRKRRFAVLAGKSGCEYMARTHQIWTCKGKQNAWNPEKRKKMLSETIKEELARRKEQPTSNEPVAGIREGNIKQRTEICACCGKRKLVIEIHLE